MRENKYKNLVDDRPDIIEKVEGLLSEMQEKAEMQIYDMKKRNYLNEISVTGRVEILLDEAVSRAACLVFREMLNDKR